MPRIFNKDIPCLQPSQCNLCGKILTRKASLLEHIRDIHESDKKIVCTVRDCKYKTNRVGNFNLHLKKVHKINLPIIRCYTPGCGKVSRNENSLIKHMRSCKGKPLIKTIKCTEKTCSEEFLTDEGLQNHLIIKHNHLTKEEIEEIEEIEERKEKVLMEKFHNDIQDLLFV